MNFILSFLLAFACTNTDVLIVGDSQAGEWVWGGALEEEFFECGAGVDRYSMPGWNSSRILSFVQGEENVERYGIFPGHVSRYEVVIIISGDNDIHVTDEEAQLEAVIEMIQYFEEAGAGEVFFSIPPPATVIGNMQIAAESFHYLEGSEDRRHWFRSGLYEEKMVYRESLRSLILNETGAHVWDLVEIAENCNVRFPRFPDGVHIDYHFAQDLAECIVP